MNNANQVRHFLETIFFNDTSEAHEAANGIVSAMLKKDVVIEKAWLDYLDGRRIIACVLTSGENVHIICE